MRKIVQKQIMDMIPAIWDGVQYIQTAEPENALHVLQDCLLAMETLRESLRSGLSERRLEYYQCFYDRAFLSLSNIKKGLDLAGQIPEVYTSLDTILIDITKEKEVKLEILFLPYKASMWDSLESIWLAVKDDSKYDAYVMPIPYCDRNPDGSAATWHCEADLFPEYVPVIDFHQYDIAKRKPDVVYIHNPYDGYNRVTSVDSKYYSSELKKNTDMLVYVPYFVVGNASLDGHFCQIPGVINADRVIVESEEIKKQYELAYLGGKPPENKFLALGSPKFDKVLNSSQADFILPQKWKEMMYGKKVILYNTSLAAMLENPNEVNKKLRYVLSVFKNRKDVVLWWRPHPLIKATMQSMHPEIFREYENIEQEYKFVAWGIYDDSADLHRAISWSDAYYGDMSSVIWLYKITGKPIWIQKMNILQSGNINISSSFCDIATDDASMYFTHDYINGLFKMNLITQKMEFMGRYPDQSLFGWHKFLLIKIFSDKLIIAPWFSQDIIEYDINTKMFSKTKILIKDKYQENIYLKTVAMERYENFVFIVGAQGTIVRYDLVTRQYKYYNEHFEFFKEKFDLGQNILSFSYNLSCVFHEKLLIPMKQGNFVMVLDMKTENLCIQAIGNEQNRYVSIVFDGTVCWLLEKNRGTLVRWDVVSNHSSEYEFLSLTQPIMLNAFSDMVASNGTIIAFPYSEYIQKENVYYFNTNTFKAYKAKDNKLLNDSYFFAKKVNNKVFSFAPNNHKLNCGDGLTTMVKSVDLKIPQELLNQISLEKNKTFRQDEYPIHEETFIGRLSDIINEFVKEPLTDNKNIKYLDLHRRDCQRYLTELNLNKNIE